MVTAITHITAEQLVSMKRENELLSCDASITLQKFEIGKCTEQTKQINNNRTGGPENELLNNDGLSTVIQQVCL